MNTRLAQSTDFEALYVLFRNNDFLPQGITKENFLKLCHWLYLSHPSQLFFELVVCKDEQIIGHHGLTPFELKTESASLMAGFASNLLIDHRHRNALIFLGLQKEFFGKYTNAGFDCIFGLVNKPDVLSTHLKTGYKKIFDVPVFARPIHFGNLTKKILKGPTGSFLSLLSQFLGYFYNIIFNIRTRVNIFPVEAFDNEVNNLCRQFQDKWTITSVRNKEILNWRFNELKYRDYSIFYLKENSELKGYIVLRKMPMKDFSTIAIVDLVWDLSDIKYANSLIRFACTFAQQQNVDLVSILISPVDELLNELKRCGFLKSPEKFTLVVNYPKSKKLFLDENYDKKWFVSWFDHDFV